LIKFCEAAVDSLARHLMIDFTQMKSFARDPLVLEQGSGIRVVDDAGRSYIDGLSGVFTTNLGHGNHEIASAIVAQLSKLAFGAPTMATTTTTLRLVERLLAILPSQYETMKFLSGGSEATESAMKLARQYHRQTGNRGKYKILAHYRAYHGGTGNALAASGSPGWKVPYEPMAPGFVHLQTPDPDSPPFAGMDHEAATDAYLAMARATIELEGPDTIAALITEPIMLSAGVIVPPDRYLRGLRELCDQYGILLIFDEIITGFGRTGTWFGAAHSAAWPDILCCGKGITSGYSPLSAVFMTGRVADAFWGEPEEAVQFFSGHTYGGNPVSCAAAIASIDYIESHSVLAHVVRVGERLRARLEELAGNHSTIALVRGRGMLQGLVFTEAARARVQTRLGMGGEVAREARTRGLLLRASPWFVAVGPPLVTTEAEIEEILGILDESLTAAEAGVEAGAGLEAAAPGFAMRR
jgi:adenosylmethionine-8-amino-7-oxononanoate aminotransferase